MLHSSGNKAIVYHHELKTKKPKLKAEIIG